jgi:hypothetical protein
VKRQEKDRIDQQKQLEAPPKLGETMEPLQEKPYKIEIDPKIQEYLKYLYHLEC